MYDEDDELEDMDGSEELYEYVNGNDEEIMEDEIRDNYEHGGIFDD